MTDTYYKGHVIKVEPDYNVDWDEVNPRTTCDNLGKFALFHNRNSVPNETDLRMRDYTCWAEMRDAIERIYDVAIILPVYGYEHSGFWMSTKVEPYWWHYRWDGGVLGFIFATKEDVRKWYGVKRVTRDIKVKVKEELTAEVNEYSNANSGTFFGYDVLDDVDGEILDGGRLFLSEEDAEEAGKEFVDRRILLGW